MRTDEALIVPTDLEVTATADGACGVLSVAALTLHQGQTNAELYVALMNRGGTPACSPAFSVELFDEAENAVATGLGGLLVRRFYRLTDGSGTLAACVAPGDVSMLAIRDFPPDFSVAEVARVAYRCTFWSLEAEPVGELSATDVHRISSDTGVAFAGALVNGLDVPLGSPAVAVFPLSRVGRPLGVALSDNGVEIPPGGSWEFETDSVTDAGAQQAAYPMSGP